MQKIINTIPGYRVYEYLLVLSPHEELWNRIQKVKEEFAGKFECEQARWGKPHITLVNFVQYEMMQERLLNRLRVVAMGTTPFKVELKDFGSFPSHSIYINVLSKIAVQSLIKTVRSESQKLMKLDDDNKPHFIMEPHLTIARKLKPWQYENGWKEYSNKYFTGRFIAGGMTLLRRLAGESPDGHRVKYHAVANLQFENMPVLTKQGELFSF